jgi:hypothetical protein
VAVTGSSNYPSGLYASQRPPGYAPYNQLNDENQLGQVVGDDPSFESDGYLQMSVSWLPIDCCVGGTAFFRANAEMFLSQEPAELEDAWQRRVSRATFSPFTVRIAEQAAGLVLRKPIVLESKEQDGDVDSYWEEFLENVDGRGTSLSAFARRVLISSLLWGHAGCLVDYPSREAAPSLQAERLAGMRPYFQQCDAKQLIGWRFEEGNPLSPVQQVRINEYVSVPFGEFGDKTIRQIRVLEPGKYRVYRREADRNVESNGSGSQGWYVHEQGNISLNVVPLALTYSQKISEFVSTPPLLSIAHLNISHSQRNADLAHGLHVAAMPIMVLKGFDDAPDPAGLSVNNAILLPPEGDAFMVEPASQSFEAQQAYLTQLEEQMASLGISTLFAQKQSAETAESKRLSRTDSDSLLSIVSKDLEGMLQTAFEMAGAYVGKEAPRVILDKDFDLQQLDGAQVGQYLSLWNNGAITQETLLNALKKGEILPGIDVEEEVELTSQEKLDNMMAETVPSYASPQADEEGNERRDEEVQGAATERLRRLAQERREEDNEE